MRKLHLAMLAGIATLAVAGGAAAATAPDHILNIALPDGSVEQIHYTGDAPRLVFVPTRAMAAPAPIDVADAFDGAPFAMFDRIAAQMEQQHAAMMRQIAAMNAMPAVGNGKIDTAAFGRLPAGTVQYSFVSTSSSDGKTCSRSMQVSSAGEGLKPKVVCVRPRSSETPRPRTNTKSPSSPTHSSCTAPTAATATTVDVQPATVRPLSWATTA